MHHTQHTPFTVIRRDRKYKIEGQRGTKQKGKPQKRLSRVTAQWNTTKAKRLYTVAATSALAQKSTRVQLYTPIPLCVDLSQCFDHEDASEVI